MKEHPDYKYRPRRKPKTMVQQKKNDAGSNGGGGGGGCVAKRVPYLVRDLLSRHESSGRVANPVATVSVLAGGEQLQSSAAAKFPQAYFSPYNNHLYPPSIYQQVAKDLSTAAGGGAENDAAGKAVHDLALQALYGSTLYSRAVTLATAWPMMTAAASGGVVGCPANCAECGHHAERPPVQQPTQRPAHESSCTPSPTGRSPSQSLSAVTAVIKRPIALQLIKPDRAVPVGLRPQHVI